MNLIKESNVQILEGASDWKDAVRQSIAPLEREGFVTEAYKEAIIENIEQLGPYICIAPRIALPHARPEQGVLESQIAVTLFRREVDFNREDARANLFIALAAADSDSHLDVLMQITDILQNEEKTAVLLFIQEVLSTPAIFVGLVAMLGLLLQKSGTQTVVKGTIMTILGFVVLNAGSTVVQEAIVPFGNLFQIAFGVEGVLPMAYESDHQGSSRG